MFEGGLIINDTARQFIKNKSVLSFEKLRLLKKEVYNDIHNQNTITGTKGMDL